VHRMDEKKWLYIGGGVVVLYLAYKWYQNYEANAQANAANAAQQSDQELAQLMMQQPLAYADTATQPVTTSGPSVDTGNSSLQDLINSILNPSGTSTDTGTSTGTSAATTPKQITNIGGSRPLSGLGHNVSTVNPVPVISNASVSPILTATTQPSLELMPLGSNTIQ